MDVSDFEKVQHLRKQIEKDLGSVDILISNAGLMPLLSLREGTEKEIQRIVDVNILANLYVSSNLYIQKLEKIVFFFFFILNFIFDFFLTS